MTFWYQSSPITSKQWLKSEMILSKCSVYESDMDLLRRTWESFFWEADINEDAPEVDFPTIFLRAFSWGMKLLNKIIKQHEWAKADTSSVSNTFMAIIWKILLLKSTISSLSEFSKLSKSINILRSSLITLALMEALTSFILSITRSKNPSWLRASFLVLGS